MGHEFDHYERMRSISEREEDALYELQHKYGEALGEPPPQADPFDLNTDEILVHCALCQKKFNNHTYANNDAAMVEDERIVDELIAEYQYLARYTDGVGNLKAIKRSFLDLHDWLESCYACYKAAV